MEEGSEGTSSGLPPPPGRLSGKERNAPAPRPRGSHFNPGSYSLTPKYATDSAPKIKHLDGPKLAPSGGPVSRVSFKEVVTPATEEERGLFGWLQDALTPTSSVARGSDGEVEKESSGEAAVLGASPTATKNSGEEHPENRERSRHSTQRHHLEHTPSHEVIDVGNPWVNMGKTLWVFPGWLEHT